VDVGSEWIDAHAHPPQKKELYLVTDGRSRRLAWFHGPFREARSWWDCQGSQIHVTHYQSIPVIPEDMPAWPFKIPLSEVKKQGLTV